VTTWVEELLVTALEGKLPYRRVRLAATGNIDLAGLDTIDGVVAQPGDRIATPNQTDETQRLIWIAAEGGWALASDSDTQGDLVSGLVLYVSEGTFYGGKEIILRTPDDPIYPGATELEWELRVAGGFSAQDIQDALGIAATQVLVTDGSADIVGGGGYSATTPAAGSFPKWDTGGVLRADAFVPSGANPATTGEHRLPAISAIRAGAGNDNVASTTATTRTFGAASLECTVQGSALAVAASVSATISGPSVDLVGAGGDGTLSLSTELAINMLDGVDVSAGASMTLASGAGLTCTGTSSISCTTTSGDATFGTDDAEGVTRLQADTVSLELDPNSGVATLTLDASNVIQLSAGALTTTLAGNTDQEFVIESSIAAMGPTTIYDDNAMPEASMVTYSVHMQMYAPSRSFAGRRTVDVMRDTAGNPTIDAAQDTEAEQRMGTVDNPALAGVALLWDTSTTHVRLRLTMPDTTSTPYRLTILRRVFTP
jgi:hypothetical protein